MSKSYQFYENPKLYKRVVESIESDEDYNTFENWIFIIMKLSYHSPVYDRILKDYILLMFSKER